MKPLLAFVRYGLPLLFLVGGIVMFAIAPTSSIGVDGLCMGIVSSLALLVMNVLWRMGFEGDKDRVAEEEARRYLTQHGHWPDEDDE